MKVFVFVAIFCGVFAAVKQCNMPIRPTICPAIYGPVCGTKTDGSKQTYDNYCSACADTKVVSYEEGKGCNGESVNPPLAPSPIIRPPSTPGFALCGPYKKGIMCIQIYQPVCALLKDGTRRTEGNSCTACTNINVVGYEQGECNTDPSPIIDPTPIIDPIPVVDPLPPTTSGKFTMCPSGPRQQGCNKMLQETCGFRFTGLPQNYGNTCTACADANVFGYIIGNCSDIVKTCSSSRVNCQLIKAPFIQSCAFEKGKAPYDVSNNLCCQDSTYDQVITGVCPSIQKPSTVCPVKRTPNCPRLYKPVCGLLNNKSRQTYSNGCVACADKNVRSYVDGQC